MCYSNCPYERSGEYAGDCSKQSMQGTELSHCREPEDEVIDPDEEPDH